MDNKETAVKRYTYKELEHMSKNFNARVSGLSILIENENALLLRKRFEDAQQQKKEKERELINEYIRIIHSMKEIMIFLDENDQQLFDLIDKKNQYNQLVKKNEKYKNNSYHCEFYKNYQDLNDFEFRATRMEKIFIVASGNRNSLRTFEHNQQVLSQLKDDIKQLSLNVARTHPRYIEQDGTISSKIDITDLKGLYKSCHEQAILKTKMAKGISKIENLEMVFEKLQSKFVFLDEVNVQIDQKITEKNNSLGLTYQIQPIETAHLSVENASNGDQVIVQISNNEHQDIIPIKSSRLHL